MIVRVFMTLILALLAAAFLLFIADVLLLGLCAFFRRREPKDKELLDRQSCVAENQDEQTKTRKNNEQ